MKNYVQNGDTIQLTAPTAGGGVESGQVVLLGAVTTGQVVIAKDTKPTGENYIAQAGGVALLPKAAGTGTALAAGTVVSINVSTGNVATNAPGTGFHRCGRVWSAAGDSDTEVAVKLYDV